MQTTQPSPTKLSRRQMLRFSVGDLSTGIPLTIIMFFQLFFLTDVAGLRPDLAGWAVGLGRFWDAINDPIFGILSDRIRSRYGRRRVVLLFASIPLGISFMLLWIIPPFGPIGLTAYYALAFILFDTAFTLIHVSYNSLTPEMTRDYDERSTLNGYRMVVQISGTLAAIILVTVASWYIADKKLLFILVGVCLGIATALPPLVVFKVTSEPSTEDKVPTISFWSAILATLKTRPFWMVMGMFLFSWTTASVISAMLVYFINYYLLIPEQANYFVLVAQFCAILFVPLMVWLAHKLDKRRAFIIGTASWVVVLLVLASARPDQVVLCYLLAALSGMGIATAYVLPWSMVPDVVEYDQLRTGERREGSFYAFTSFFQKLGTGIALWGLGQILALTGYITPSSAVSLPVQPHSAVLAIRITMGLAPAILLLPAILLAWRYPITRKSHEDLKEQIRARFTEGD
jgi:glycoside/pentoside/hexuronide:cation symporter, GPH family